MVYIFILDIVPQTLRNEEGKKLGLKVSDKSSVQKESDAKMSDVEVRKHPNLHHVWYAGMLIPVLDFHVCLQKMYGIVIQIHSILHLIELHWSVESHFLIECWDWDFTLHGNFSLPNIPMLIFYKKTYYSLNLYTRQISAHKLTCFPIFSNISCYQLGRKNLKYYSQECSIHIYRYSIYMRKVKLTFCKMTIFTH